MKVELIDVMGDDLRVANAARVSFGKWKEELNDGDAKLIHYLAANEHSSPFRHTAITLRCSAPIFLARQLGKHQVGMSWNEVSRRYVKGDFKFFEFDSIRMAPEGSIKQGSAGVHPASGIIKDEISFMEDRCLELYTHMVNNGVAPEQARAVLPQSMMTEWVWTGSLISFFHLVRLRKDVHAQVEAQQFAIMVDEICKKLFPISWKELMENA